MQKSIYKLEWRLCRELFEKHCLNPMVLNDIEELNNRFTTFVAQFARDLAADKDKVVMGVEPVNFRRPKDYIDVTVRPADMSNAQYHSRIAANTVRVDKLEYTDNA